MSLSAIYQSLSDPTRLRILNLLAASPLCVQHLQTALETGQVMVSKHLLILKANGLVEAQKIRNWRLYRLPEKATPSVRKNLDCLLGCIHDEGLFEDDLGRLQSLRPEIQRLVKPVPKAKRSTASPKTNRRPALRPSITPPLAPSTVETLEDHLL